MSEIQPISGQNNAKISVKQRKAVECFINGGTVESAAMTAGVTVRTIYVWRTQSNFKQALDEAQNEALGTAVIALSGATVDAVQVLRSIAIDKESPPATRVAAARAILDSAIRLKELFDLEQRVAQLERGIAA